MATLNLLFLLISVQVWICKSQLFSSDVVPHNPHRCSIPITLHGEWFSYENGENTFTKISYDSMSDSNGLQGSCVEMLNTNFDNLTIVLSQRDCYHCIRVMIRTLNVLEKISTGCINIDSNQKPSIESVCRSLDPNKEYITMFSMNPSGKNCRSSLEGVWNIAYQNKFFAASECIHPEANITACQQPGTHFFNVNSQFSINYRQCEGMEETQNAEVEYICLGDWYIGKNHYFAVVNSRDTRIDERYRCFLANRDDDIYLSKSITPQCNTLRSPQEGPERFRLIPVKAETVPVKCTLPYNFTGNWVNTANFDAKVIINSTHMVERWRPDDGREKKEIYVCQERRDTRFVMARLGINGCQKDFVCFDFVARHHNIIRYRKGQTMITDKFATVCAWTMFDDKEEWKYDFMIQESPVGIKCPVAGKFQFTQRGEQLFETRIRGGVTEAPIPNVYCHKNISDFSVCDKDQKTIKIDADYCISLDYVGRPKDIYTQPDYVMNCVGFWKENLKSYLITFDPLDAQSKYRCWVYQRTGLTEFRMSMAVGAFCHIKQDVYSYDSREGAQVALTMIEYEREHDNCGMYFDDGEDPYREVDNSAVQLSSAVTNRVEFTNLLVFFTIIFVTQSLLFR